MKKCLLLFLSLLCHVANFLPMKRHYTAWLGGESLKQCNGWHKQRENKKSTYGKTPIDAFFIC